MRNREGYEEEQMSNLDCESVSDLITEVKRLRDVLDKIEHRLMVAEDVLGRSDWNTIYREIIEEGEE